VAPLVALLVDLILFGANKGALVNIRVNLNVRIVAELEVVLWGPLEMEDQFCRAGLRYRIAN